MRAPQPLSEPPGVMLTTPACVLDSSSMRGLDHISEGLCLSLCLCLDLYLFLSLSLSLPRRKFSSKFASQAKAKNPYSSLWKQMHGRHSSGVSRIGGLLGRVRHGPCRPRRKCFMENAAVNLHNTSIKSVLVTQLCPTLLQPHEL